MKNYKKIVFITSSGHMLECYDVTLYGFFAVLLSPIFFPSNNFIASMIGTFGAFAAGFIMRPIGGIIFGHIGDKVGRKYSFLLSIVLMTIPTIGIGCLPSYETIGITSPILLILFRLIQGIALGGEYGGATVFINEHIKENKPGFAGSIIVTLGFAGAIIGTILGAIFTQDFMPVWAWRVPFFLGGVFGIIVFYFRIQLQETPEFSSLCSEKNTEYYPIFAVLKKDLKNVLCCAGIGMHTITPFYISVIFINLYYDYKFKISMSNTLAINTGIMFLWVLTLPFAGYIADKFNRKKIMLYSAICTCVVSIPAFYTMLNTDTFLIFFLCQLLISFSSIPYVAVTSSILPLLFPKVSRYSGVAFSFSLGVALCGGTSPLIATTLINSGITIGPAIYLFISGVVGYLSVYFASNYRYN